MREPTTVARLKRFTAREPPAAAEDVLATEEPLEIRMNGRPVAVTMRTPGNDADLARGFAWTESLVRDAGALPEVRVVRNPLDASRGNIVDLRVPPDALGRAPATRNFYTTSSCGVCGKASLDAVTVHHAPVESDLRVSRGTLYGFPGALRDAQAVFERTGGLHAAGLFDADGTLHALREDVGRHNAVDKVVGWTWREGRLPFADGVLMVSGRASFEILQKAVALGVPVVAAVSAPSSLAVDAAQRFGVTLVGFLRGETMNVYTHEERVVA